MSESIRLVERWKNGDEHAAQELFATYIARVLRVADGQLWERVRVRVDVDDVAQSVLKSFLFRVRNGEFHPESGGMIWAMLAAMTRNKVKEQHRAHTQTQSRDVGREQQLVVHDPDDSTATIAVPLGAIAVDHTDPTESAAMTEELEMIEQQLDDPQKSVLHGLLAGKTVAELAIEANVTDRTIQRWRRRITTLLADRLEMAG